MSLNKKYQFKYRLFFKEYFLENWTPKEILEAIIQKIDAKRQFLGVRTDDLKNSKSGRWILGSILNSYILNCNTPKPKTEFLTPRHGSALDHKETKYSFSWFSNLINTRLEHSWILLSFLTQDIYNFGICLRYEGLS